jgi:hypothetical protein
MRNLDKKLQADTPVGAAQRGVAAIELAILLPLLVLIFTGMIEYGRLMWHYDVLAKATRDAARYLSNEQDVAAAMASARNMVDNTAAAAGVGDLDGGDVSITCAPGCQAPESVTVGISYGFTIGGWVPVIGPLNTSVLETELSPHTTMPYMR